ncbi:hypothetical protein HELRODRAFT_137984, partial [Helobdella robusta]|uniref:Ion transport domain-containing protein n=1 Tax=Helobdella robusta TaxID=6412 RepID=T1EIQ6_HELRO
VKYPDDCCPQSCMNLCKCFQFIETTKVGQTWWAFRRCMFELVENNYFETFIIVMILLSSLAL